MSINKYLESSLTTYPFSKPYLYPLLLHPQTVTCHWLLTRLIVLDMASSCGVGLKCNQKVVGCLHNSQASVTVTVPTGISWVVLNREACRIYCWVWSLMAPLPPPLGAYIFWHIESWPVGRKFSGQFQAFNFVMSCLTIKLWWATKSNVNCLCCSGGLWGLLTNSLL